MSCIGVRITRKEGISVRTERLGSLGVNVSVCCDSGHYLVVTPNNLWVTNWDTELVDVKSNTDWKVD